jgi:hypothetical protein
LPGPFEHKEKIVDSIISLALASKLEKLFATDDKFLAFPLGVGFPYRALDFMKGNSQDNLNYSADFARCLNILPDDSPSLIPDASRFLWNELKKVLEEARFAQSGLTEEEDKKLEKAIDFLTDAKIVDGVKIPINSEAVTKYYEYKDIYDRALRVYLDEQITVESSSGVEGEKLKKQWDSYREKELKEIRDRAEQEWIDLGFKREVENCQSIRNNLEVKKYLNLYRQAYLNEIDISEIVDLNGLGIAVSNTFFSPIDAFDVDSPWIKINITKNEISTLVQDSPVELSGIFPGTQAATGIEYVSLEYNNVVIMRPWFKPEFFESRFWNLPDGSQIVSDGLTPRKGRLPCYITSMIVARNVSVTRRKAVGSVRFSFSILKPNVQLQQLMVKRIMTPKLQPAVTINPLKNLPNTTGRINDLNAMRVLMKDTVVRRGSFVTLSNLQKTTLTANVKAKYLDVKSAGTTIKAIPLKIPTKPLSPDTELSELVTEKYSFDGVYVLAYVCKRVPKSPNPDLSLPW